MKKHLFLLVSPDSEESALIKNTLGFSLCIAGGYVTERISSPEEAPRVVLKPAAAAGGAVGYDCPPILDLSGVSARKDTEVWRGMGTRLLSEAAYYPFAVAEIGGYELVVPQFRRELASLLSSGLPLLGNLLRKDASSALGKSLGLGRRYLMLVDRLHEALSEDPDTLLIDPSSLGVSAAQGIVRQWIKEYVP